MGEKTKHLFNVLWKNPNEILPNSIQGFNIGCLYTMAYNIKSINLEILLFSFSRFLK